MRQAHLEQDMVSEQKNLLGFMSIRQAIYCFIGIVVIYNLVKYVFKFSNLFMGIVPSIVSCLIIALPIPAIIFFFAFKRHPQTKYYHDKNLLLRFVNKHEIGFWRKGTNSNLVKFEEMGGDN